ncbi:hypothetical protein BDK51DRAFT_42463 [Blyttiomyces helicus]|uniref:Arrestin-like N-terminal domain-containing protein n=1 Tax=Blyttiomyces helicus TaxID=388810 RepID=A0A4P9W2M5_9FUNG|nr:hypothetical protein BDK51DRAFT_42463 [Blyttiomyces helicus]|eukprot:RKO86509.1 hypothetical protein BDK51DRAFT_42463 [Blyttiomyces helicus]
MPVTHIPSTFSDAPRPKINVTGKPLTSTSFRMFFGGWDPAVPEVSYGSVPHPAIEYFQIHLHEPHVHLERSAPADGHVSGVVSLQLRAPFKNLTKLSLRLRGVEKVHTKPGGRFDPEQGLLQENIFLDATSTIWTPTKEEKTTPGFSKTWNFSVPIRASSPASYESDEGYIAYFIDATLHPKDERYDTVPCERAEIWVHRGAHITFGVETYMAPISANGLTVLGNRLLVVRDLWTRAPGPSLAVPVELTVEFGDDAEPIEWVRWRIVELTTYRANKRAGFKATQGMESRWKIVAEGEVPPGLKALEAGRAIPVFLTLSPSVDRVLRQFVQGSLITVTHAIEFEAKKVHGEACLRANFPLLVVSRI